MMAKKQAAAKKKVSSEETKSGDDSKLFAFLATFLSIIGFIIAIIAKKDNQYVMYYAKQSLGIFLLCVVAGIFMHMFILAFVGWIIEIVATVLWVISWIYALSGQEKEVPLIGKYSLGWFKSL
jgi:uncharacterized membrane protein